MVDSITAKPITGGRAGVVPATPIAAIAPATSAATTVSASPVDIAQAGGLARSMATSAPVDTDRVATIRKAIADGRFPILPATIADRLIAFKLHWDPNGPQQHDQA